MTFSIAIRSAPMRDRGFADGPSRPWSAARTLKGVSSSGQAGARSRDLAGDLVLIGRQQPAVEHNYAPVYDHGRRARGRRQRDPGEPVRNPGVGEVVDPVEGHVGALPDLQRAAVL